MKGKTADYLLIDEISMVAVPLLAILDQLRAGGAKIICFGDWKQLPPHPEGNTWRGTKVNPRAFQRSRLYQNWADCTRFELTICKRSDQAHFDFYTDLGDHLGQALETALGKYKKAEDGDLHVCLSHNKRRAINSEKHNIFAANKSCVEIPAHEKEPGYQLCLGTKLIGCCTSGNIVNGGRYVVLAIGETIRLKGKEEFSISPEVLSRTTQLGYACVYQKVQGRTEGGTVVLHDLTHRYATIEHLYVGISRVTHGSRAFICL